MGDADARLRQLAGGSRPLSLERAGGSASARTLPRALRPRDSGSLAIVDDSGSKPRVLMGRRSAAHAFMSGKYVFPGGRVEPSDLRLAREFSLSGAAAARLMGSTPKAFTARHAVALALATVRETFEEVGAMIGVREPFVSSAPSWREFAKAGLRPDIAGLVPFARAITPTGHVRRFDTRFFAIPASAIVSAIRFDARPTDEFDDVVWIGLDEVRDLDLATITRMIADDLSKRLAEGCWRDAGQPMPFYRKRKGEYFREMV